MPINVRIPRDVVAHAHGNPSSSVPIMHTQTSRMSPYQVTILTNNYYQTYKYWTATLYWVLLRMFSPSFENDTDTKFTALIGCRQFVNEMANLHNFANKIAIMLGLVSTNIFTVDSRLNLIVDCCRQSIAPNLLNLSILTGRCVECMALNSSPNGSTSHKCVVLPK